MVGLANALIGLIKIIKGAFTFNLKLFADGLFSSVRGAVEITTTPLTWFIKPLTRGLATLCHGGFKKIEENKGIQSLVHLGQKNLSESETKAVTSSMKAFELLGICHDLHRKYHKSISRGQATSIETKQEEEIFRRTMAHPEIGRQALAGYFALFSVPEEKGVKEREAADEPLIIRI